MKKIEWEVIHFRAMAPALLYAVMRLRQEVFVVEQQCVYLDCDGKDTPAYHLAGMVDSELAAYARLLPPGVSYPEASIGRIVTSPAFRGQGFGKRLMAKALEEASRLFGDTPIRIGAQTYLVGFYRTFGFEPLAPYVEDGIPHTHMLRQAHSTRS